MEYGYNDFKPAKLTRLQKLMNWLRVYLLTASVVLPAVGVTIMNWGA